METQRINQEPVQTREATLPATITDINAYRVRKLLSSTAKIKVSGEYMFSKVPIKDLFTHGALNCEGKGKQAAQTGAVVVIRRKNGSYECIADGE